ncbi:hypothetical protein NBRC10512_005725 [Rhodotorula toruloides]|uniref:RHTO0S21e00254g1_1 n=2 Tax=Rhodotorula toruloides TaxID=5286 RepID=A0A061BFW6_RHOTO|nr:protein transport protein SEC24 [Rhodotorula toruloides NP11]EMS20901.1 protein transport protein SEC24 [Rhodotorula toruloides NP11]CDR48853.1 RHTO0S21e00254g1_1 [Rhodotorula toruloides]
MDPRQYAHPQGHAPPLQGQQYAQQAAHYPQHSPQGLAQPGHQPPYPPLPAHNAPPHLNPNLAPPGQDPHGRFSPMHSPAVSPGVDHLSQGVVQMGLQPSQATTPGGEPMPSPAVVPARGKRAARAYHNEGASPAAQMQPSPAEFQQTGQQPSYFPPQGQPQHAGAAVGHQQQPHYQEAPPPHLARDPRTAPPASYHDSNGPGIPQPPHTAGQRIPAKQRVRIDPDHIPSPVAVQEADQHLYRIEPYLTCSRNPAPLATTDFVAVDQGNCNPRFIRMTTYNLPTSDDLALASQLPLGLIVQPFAALRPEEGSIPVVDFGESGPPRCERCRGYINPWCTFVEGGQKYICNLCGASTQVAPEYFSHLDMSQRRMDLDQRPELRLGSVDFVVNRDYWVQDNPNLPGSQPREPKPLHHVFAIDVSYTSVQSGLVKEICTHLKELLFLPKEGEVEENGVFPPRKGLPAGAKVAIMTFDRTVQFYNLKPGLDQAQMLVVPDITDMFLPLNDGFLVDPLESRPAIEGLLDSLPGLTAETSIVEAAMTGPLKAAMLALKSIGGQLNIFQTSLPTIGLGALKHREDNKLYGTDKEKTLFGPQDPFYRIAAEECVEAGIGINLFLFPSQYIDAATLGALPGLTGGDLFFHPRFNPVRDGRTLRAELGRVLQRETAYSVTMRIRCSNGLRVADHYGNFFQRNVTDLEFGTIDADKAVAAKIKHEGKLDEKADAHFQCAALYTSAAGERRVRVHNLAVPVSSLISGVFRAADMDTTITFLTKEAITHASSKTLRQVREQLTDTCVNSLLAYRKHCASSTSPAQLILPESFKLFPLYSLAVIKTKALKGGTVASDVRTWAMRQLKAMGAPATVRILYPRMMAIHLFSDDIGFPDERGQLVLPPLMRTSYSRMEPHGAYLVENGERAILWLGQAVSPQLLQDLYGIENLDELDTRLSTLPNLPTRLSAQLRNIITYFESRSGVGCIPVLIARQNIDGTEFEFSNMLVEDSNNEQLSYVDYLCMCHQKIQSTLMGEKNKDVADSSSWTTW